ncbi:hypothetical protein ADK70_31245 [Streptomyces rimosus subsp. pseudoverticillatus]|uniref:hypothetical protein n=1 Tax=Streptomyces rimosus TaxID=1927 RepID=UPI0006B28BE1|nr:hypothetical protein [Streptomyces rimosus]KOT79252.1 hypothetical protein ADK70_31245 [Streptomyces rimosus subsp. pseudoverticillatus]
MAEVCASANRYNGLDDMKTSTLATLTDTSLSEVRAAHKADIAAWKREQELAAHPDLAAVDADLDRIFEQHRAAEIPRPDHRTGDLSWVPRAASPLAPRPAGEDTGKA